MAKRVEIDETNYKMAEIQGKPWRSPKLAVDGYMDSYDFGSGQVVFLKEK